MNSLKKLMRTVSFIFIYFISHIYLHVYAYNNQILYILIFFFLESGRLEFSEFVQLAAKFIVEEDAEAMQKELREAFRLYDKKGEGFIPTSCLREILKELDDALSDEDLDNLIEEIDSDGSGTVDFDGEFLVHCFIIIILYYSLL